MSLFFPLSEKQFEKCHSFSEILHEEISSIQDILFLGEKKCQFS